MYVIIEQRNFDENQPGGYKSDDLEKVKNFIREKGLETDWIEFEDGGKIAISECDTYAVEIAKGTEKVLKDMPML